jgi:hypothetical protein
MRKVWRCHSGDFPGTNEAGRQLAGQVSHTREFSETRFVRNIQQEEMRKRSAIQRGAAG